MKKFLIIPVCMLLLLTAAALLNAWHTGNLVDAWCESVEQAEIAASSGNWDLATQKLNAAHDSWTQNMVYFHIVLQHEELNDAEELFAQAESYLGAREAVDFCACSASLCSQLRVLSEMQQVSIKNIL